MKCENKQQYRTQGDAKAAADGIAKRKGIFLKIYLCPECEQWHHARKGRDAKNNRKWIK